MPLDSYYANVSCSKFDLYWSYSLVRQGAFPCSLGVATAAVTICVLEIFCILSLHCPCQSIQPFIKSICDLQGVPFKPYLQEQFSIVFDLYLEVHSCGSPNWHLANACPCCLYCIEGELTLMLATMDSNNFLKQLARRVREKNNEGNITLGKLNEALDSCTGGSDYYLSCEEVDQWSKENIQGVLEAEEAEEENLCKERWKNLDEALTSKMWGVYDKMGVIILLCCHSFVLLVVNMVQSRELAKYPLTTVNKLLEVIRKDIGMGYDIGCSFNGTLTCSPLGQKARQLSYTLLIHAFHGHAHSHLCQILNLAMYMSGLELEHLEQWETFFSQSNELASSV
ncbi:hypothetical protein GYMLUDRAFT_156801 [Collybiopsis luxurians FD-317 M1]|nr:hypothetical protein GYMLUDRAFT_156801 [Collybiopsis luxurians FD-317 M1]